MEVIPHDTVAKALNNDAILTLEFIKMAEEAVGTIVLMVDGQEYDCASCDAQAQTGNRPIPTMNRKMRTKYVAKGNKAYSLNVAVVIPDGKDTVNWDSLEGAQIAIESVSGNHRTTYVDCFSTEVSEAYSVEGETRRTVAIFALDKLQEDI